jgi:hypothetical protein
VMQKVQRSGKSRLGIRQILSEGVIHSGKARAVVVADIELRAEIALHYIACADNLTRESESAQIK